MIPLRTPHSIRVLRPAKPNDTGTNMSEFDYQNPSSNRLVDGFFQSQPGRNKQSPDGRLFTYDADFFTEDETIAPDDMLVLEGQAGVYGNFVVTGVQPCCDLDGDVNHREMTLTKNIQLPSPT